VVNAKFGCVRGRKRVTYCDRVNATMPCGRMYPERTRGPRSNLGPLLFVTGIRLLSFTASSVRLFQLDDAQELFIRFWSHLCRAFASKHRQLIGTSGCRDAGLPTPVRRSFLLDATTRGVLTLSKPGRCRAAFRAQRRASDIPRCWCQQAGRSGSDGIAPDRGCLARPATAHNTARS
jgi:hypothetical protein